jgi:hypothetical protein
MSGLTRKRLIIVTAVVLVCSAVAIAIFTRPSALLTLTFTGFVTNDHGAVRALVVISNASPIRLKYKIGSMYSLPVYALHASDLKSLETGAARPVQIPLSSQRPCIVVAAVISEHPATVTGRALRYFYRVTHTRAPLHIYTLEIPE